MLPGGVFACFPKCDVICFLCYLPPTTQTTHVNCTCVPCFTHPGGGKARVCVCVQNLHTNFQGALAEGIRESKCGFTQSLRLCPYSASLRHAHAVCAKRRAQTLAQSLCKLELKLLVCNTHPQATPCGERLMLSVVHFLRKCRQMTSHHVELMCGATPLSFSVQVQTIYTPFTHI